MSKKFYLISSIVLSVLLVASIGVSLWINNDKEMYMTQLDNSYQQAFYDLIADVNDIEVKLGKVSVSTTPNYQKETLLDIWRQADMACVNISNFSTREDVIHSATRYFNQLGDFCKSTAKRIDSDGTPLISGEKEALNNLRKVSAGLGKDLSKLRDELGVSYRFVDAFGKDGSGGYFATEFGKTRESSIDYPELIYDGPFADSIINREPKLSDEDISVEAGAEKLAKLFEVESAKVKYESEIDGRIKTYRYTVNDVNYVEITKKGGHLLLVSREHTIDDPVLSEEECIEKATVFLEAAGYSGMQKVWLSNYDSFMYINFVYKSGEAIIYSDMVKIQVAADDGTITGFEASEYIYNHDRDRNIGSPTISRGMAEDKVDGSITIESARLAVIPKGQKDILTYEISGRDRDGFIYFIYIDARTGDEVNILRVIDSEQGQVLL